MKKSDPFCLVVTRYMIGGGQTGQRGRHAWGSSAEPVCPEGAIDKLLFCYGGFFFST